MSKTTNRVAWAIGSITAGLAAVLVPYWNFMDKRAEYYRDVLELPDSDNVSVSLSLCDWRRCEITTIEHAPDFGKEVTIRSTHTIERVIYNENKGANQ